jgi:hypothetical protein
MYRGTVVATGRHVMHPILFGMVNLPIHAVITLTYWVWFSMIDGAMRVVGAMHSTARVFTSGQSLDGIAAVYMERRHQPAPTAAPQLLLFSKLVGFDIGEYLTTDWLLSAHEMFRAQLRKCEQAFSELIMFQRRSGMTLHPPVVQGVPAGMEPGQWFRDRLDVAIVNLGSRYHSIVSDFARVLELEVGTVRPPVFPVGPIPVGRALMHTRAPLLDCDPGQHPMDNLHLQGND